MLNSGIDIGHGMEFPQFGGQRITVVYEALRMTPSRQLWRRVPL